MEYLPKAVEGKSACFGVVFLSLLLFHVGSWAVQALQPVLMNRGVSCEVLLLAWHVEQPVKINWKTSKCLQ